MTSAYVVANIKYLKISQMHLRLVQQGRWTSECISRMDSMQSIKVGIRKLAILVKENAILFN
jgi:hypothetical protein